MSTSTHAGLRRLRRRHARFAWLIVGLLSVVGAALAIDRLIVGSSPRPPAVRFVARPDLAGVIDGLVIGSARDTPGVTAYVASPRGAWLYSSGVANVATGATMPPHARIRIESLSKLFLATAALQLVQERKLRLDDTVARWLPGLLPYGGRITLRELMSDSSGLIDDNDLMSSPAAARRYLARVKDPQLRAQLLEIGARLNRNPAAVVSPIWLIRFAAWQPLLFTPGSGTHHSNIGWNIAGMIVAKAAGQPLPKLYHERIFEPLALTQTAYDPQGPITGRHATGYAYAPDGKLIDETNWHWGKGADGAIVSDARDLAAFLVALMQGRLIDHQELATMARDDLSGFGPYPSSCGGDARFGSGAGWAYSANVEISDDGSRVAVLLLNSRHLPYGDQTAQLTVAQLYCAG